MWVKIIISNALPTILNEAYVFFVFLCTNGEEFQFSGDYHFITSPGVNKIWTIYIKFLVFFEFRVILDFNNHDHEMTRYYIDINYKA